MGLVRELVLGTLLVMVFLGSVILLLVAKLRHAEELRLREHEMQETMVREMGHRLRNFVVTVQSLAFQTQLSTTRRADIPEPCRRFITDCFAEFDQKLVALGTSMAMLFRHEDRGPIKNILNTTMSGFTVPGRVRIFGPDVSLRADCILALNLVIHELATNAAKYGALSNSVGIVTLSWEIETRGKDDWLVMDWVEVGGPPVTPPSATGFGSLLMGNLALGHLRGKTTIEYPPEGVTCRIELPL